MPAFDFKKGAALAASQPRHFLELDEIAPAELRAILDISRKMKDGRAGRPKGWVEPEAPLKDHVLAMVFEKPSTRTRVSFDMAMRQLGGSTIVLNSSELQLGRGETVADTARVLSGYADAIMLRTFEPEKLIEMADNASVPVINALTDRSHPCQILTDILTFEEIRGPIAGKKLAWTGDGNNVVATFAQAAAAFGFELAIACPSNLQPDPAILDDARGAGAVISVTDDVHKAVAGADAVITDTWLSMNDPDGVRQARHNLLAPYQVDAALMDKAKPEALFMHCLPAHREEEVTTEVIDGPASVVFPEAENRLHVQKGILLWCFGLV
ncbi:MAG: ornithine carbamoyltransferase [Pseudomonadota bacterium]